MTDNVVPFPRAKTPSIRELIETHILDKKADNGHIYTTEDRFRAWLATTNWGARDNTTTRCQPFSQATAKAMLSTWIEERIGAVDGVWFGDSDRAFTLGLKGRPPILVDAPTWMRAYIRSFPKTVQPLTPAERDIIWRGEIILQQAEFEARKRWEEVQSETTWAKAA